jgi:hypothetical protein
VAEEEIQMKKTDRLSYVCALLAVLTFAVGRDAAAQDHSAHQPPAAPEHQHDTAMATLFPARDGSGTAWQPEVTPMIAFHRDIGAWSFMGHANVFAQFLYESGESHRTSQQAGSINWFMGMLRRPVGAGRAGVRAMVSLEPWTIGGCGYPDLLATGEVCDGDTIHDLQHPHDLFMEIAADYERPLGRSLRLQLYGGVAGEPALGPTAFPHRVSAFGNPIAPIAHHWLDATHIAFGVVTAGVAGARWKAEASAFNGREPDEHRTNLDLAALDSTAVRVSLLPTDRWAFQVSAGHLREAEAGLGDHAARDVDRVTASAAYHRPLQEKAFWSSTVAYGVNREESELAGRPDQTTHAVLLETAVASSSGLHNWFGRLDIVGKPGHDLHVHEDEDAVFTVAKLQFGYLRQIATVRGWAAGVGGHLNLSLVPRALAPRYNGRVAPGVGVFFNLQPAR